jgi:hypothetical protein
MGHPTEDVGKFQGKVTTEILTLRVRMTTLGGCGENGEDEGRLFEGEGEHQAALGAEAVLGAGEFEGRGFAEIAVVDFGVVAYGSYDMGCPCVVEAEAGADFTGLAGENLECGVGRRRSRSLRFAAG